MTDLTQPQGKGPSFAEVTQDPRPDPSQAALDDIMSQRPWRYEEEVEPGFFEYAGHAFLNATSRAGDLGLRVLEGVEVNATMGELAERVVAMSRIMPIDECWVEVAAQAYAMLDILRHMGVRNPRGLSPGNRNKEVRLRSAAPMLEDCNAANGVRAVVEFPGKQDENGEWYPLESVAELCAQVTSFGFHPSDHLCDALTQLCNALSGHFPMGGSGTVSEQVRREFERPTNRVAEAFAKFGENPTGPAAETDLWSNAQETQWTGF